MRSSLRVCRRWGLTYQIMWWFITTMSVFTAPLVASRPPLNADGVPSTLFTRFQSNWRFIFLQHGGGRCTVGSPITSSLYWMPWMNECRMCGGHHSWGPPATHRGGHQVWCWGSAAASQGGETGWLDCNISCYEHYALSHICVSKTSFTLTAYTQSSAVLMQTGLHFECQGLLVYFDACVLGSFTWVVL